PSNPRMRALAVILDQFVSNALMAINLRDIWQREDGNMRVGETPPHSLERRQSHDGIAHPIRRSNQQPHATTLRRSLSARSIAATNSLSELTTKSIAAT